MYRNEPKDIQKLTKRCTSFENSMLIQLKKETDESKKRTLGNNFYFLTKSKCILALGICFNTIRRVSNN
jgi:hypothetical protein